MKNLMLMCLIFTLFISCNGDDLKFDELAGKWQLVEVLMDPGDGSGTFESVISNRTITFTALGTFSSVGDLCELGISDEGSSAGQYDEENETISIDDCASLEGFYNYELNEDQLIIHYPCFEACQHKYQKIAD